MVRVRLKTKLVLAISSMVFVLVALFCYIYVSHRVRETIAAAKERADFIANEVEDAAHQATLGDVGQENFDPNDPHLVQLVLENRLQNDKGLNTLLQTIVAYSYSTYDAGIVDVSGTAIVHTNSALVGTRLKNRENYDQVLNANFLRQLAIIYGQPRVFDHELTIQRGEGPRFGKIRVGISTVFLKNEVQPQLTRALGLSAVVALLSDGSSSGV